MSQPSSHSQSITSLTKKNFPDPIWKQCFLSNKACYINGCVPAAAVMTCSFFSAASHAPFCAMVAFPGILVSADGLG